MTSYKLFSRTDDIGCKCENIWKYKIKASDDDEDLLSIIILSVVVISLFIIIVSIRCYFRCRQMQNYHTPDFYILYGVPQV